MFNTPRMPATLQILQALKPRMQFSPEQAATFHRLSRGYEGEMKFAKRLEQKLHQPCIRIFDLNLEISGTECQFDCLLIFQHGIYLIEIKNLQGDYYVDGDSWFHKNSNKEWQNPLSQIRRSDLLLRDFFNKHQFHFKVKSQIIFVEPNFYLYQAPLDQPFIFPGQQERFIHQLNRTPCQLNQLHENVTIQLKTAHIIKSTREKLPTYDYHQLKKGIVCAECECMMEKPSQHNLVCSGCGNSESIDDAIYRSTKEFHLLFPEKQIKLKSIMDWINETVSRNSVRQSLAKHFTFVDKGSESHYEVE